MKISKLLPGIILPFFMFILFGSICQTEDEDPKICAPSKTSISKTYRLNENSPKMKLQSPKANAECSAFFLVKYGWEDGTRFQTDDSPMENSFGGLKLTFGETAYSHTYRSGGGIIEQGTHPGGKQDVVWVIKLPVSAPSDTGDTYFYVDIEHNILEEDYNFWVEVSIEYSYAI